MSALISILSISKRTWLGATNSDGAWEWIDKSSWNFESWSPGQPGSEPCGMFDERGRWSSSRCDRARRFICKVACTPKKIVERFPIQATLELLALAGFNSDKMMDHGCWCPKTAGLYSTTSLEAKMGNPIDEVDMACRDWSTCQRCASEYCEGTRIDDDPNFSAAALGPEAYRAFLKYKKKQKKESQGEIIDERVFFNP